MTIVLKRHPEAACDAVTAIQVEGVRRPGDILELRYRVTGELARLELPPPADRAFADGLWRGTCLEAFIRAAGQEGYHEFNVSPSTQWAAYRFDGYREGMARADELGAPELEVRRAPGALELGARLDLGRARGLAGAPWRLGLSAVIRETNGRVSYWALEHPPGKPDFHHPDCFALDLPAPDRP